MKLFRLFQSKSQDICIKPSMGQMPGDKTVYARIVQWREKLEQLQSNPNKQFPVEVYKV